MATNHTENYQLNLWEPEDAFLRTEFNENTEKIDAAIKAVGESGLKYQFMTHGGTGKDELTLTFDFPPMVVLLIPFSGATYGAGILFRGQTTGIAVRTPNLDEQYALEWGENSVTIKKHPDHDYYATSAALFNRGTYGILALG